MSQNEHFIDEVAIEVEAGRGGDGCRNFRREKYVPRGGPDGGNGGRGGDVIVVADPNLSTLLEPHLRPEIHAEDGEKGSGNNRTGRAGQDIVLRVPVGTVLRDLAEPADESPLADLSQPGQRLCVARGGRGGRGNACFATATRQSPDYAESGREGGKRRLRLTLKLLADVGIIGLPNAGKSTLLRRISAARPRVAAYPFTTLTPSLGVVEVDERRFVAADIPGLVEGASSGAGLGDRFLRHIERTRVLVHLVDLSAWPLAEQNPLESYEAIRKELGSYDAELLQRHELVALSKIDLLPERDWIARAEALFRPIGRAVFPLSAATGEGVGALLYALATELSSTAEKSREACEDASS